MRNTRSSFLATPTSQTNNQSKLTRLYNESLTNIEKSFTLNPKDIFSTRINRWLDHQLDVRLLDQAALSWYLLGTTAHLCSGIFVYRNNREPISNNLYSFLVCGSAFGKSAFYRHFFNAMSNCPISNENNMEKITSNTKESEVNIMKTCHFLDEMSRGGLFKQLQQNDKIALLDEADACLKRNGLIVDGPISEHNNIYEIVLTLYSGEATVTKSLTNSTSNIHLKKLTILANTTEEPVLRLLKKKLSGDAPNPFAERSLFLFIATPLTLEKPFPSLWDFDHEPTISQIAFTASQLDNLDFYYETTARLITIAHGNLMCKLMIKNEKVDKWLTARLGKSRDHLHRLAVNLQLIQLTFDLIDKYKNVFGDLNHGLDNQNFQQRMKSVINEFLGRTNVQVRIKLEIRLSIVNSAVKLLNLLLHQYLCIFGDENIYLSVDDSQTSGSNQNKLDQTTALAVNVTTPRTTNNDDQLAPNEHSIKELAQAILLYDEIAFTKTKLSNCVSLWKRNTNCHKAAIELLLNKQLIIHCEKAAKQTLTSRTISVWVKCVPMSLDLLHLNQFQESLGEFNVKWSTFQRTLEKFQPPKGVIINDELANLLKSPRYQPYIQFDVDSFIRCSSNENSIQMNEEQNNDAEDGNACNTAIVNNSTASILQQSSQSNSIASLAPVITSMSPSTNISTEIPVQQSVVSNQASSSNTPMTTQFHLPRPMDLAATRLKQSAVNKSRAMSKKQIQSKDENRVDN